MVGCFIWGFKGLGAKGSGFKVQGLGFKYQGLRFRGSRVWRFRAV